MKTTVKNLDKGSYGMTANLKKLLVQIIELNNPKCFNAKFKANRTTLTIEPKGDNTYRVTEHLKNTTQKEIVHNVQVITK